MIFKLVFSIDSDKVRYETNRRLQIIYLVAGVTIFMTCIPFIISMFIGSNDRYSVAVSDQICFWMIVVVLAYSIYRIRKFSKMLVQNNVFANEFLMMAHLGFFTFLALVFMTTAILTIILRGTVDGNENH